MNMKGRFLLGIIFIAIQFIGIIYARLIPERFFCWAPFDIQTKYKITANINGIDLDSNELELRYKYRMSGWEQRSIYNVFSIITQYEETYGKNDNVKIKAIYSVNGHNEKTWEYK